MARVTWTKLQTGKWGVRWECNEPFEDLPKLPAEVVVEKKNGDFSNVTIKREVFVTDNDGKPVGVYALD